jgi:hypothetical protein
MSFITEYKMVRGVAHTQASPTLTSTQHKETSVNPSKVPETVSIVSTDPEEEPNVNHLRRVARELVKRNGSMKLNVFYSSLDAAGHSRNAVDAVMRRDQALEFALDSVMWRGDSAD